MLPSTTLNSIEIKFDDISDLLGLHAIKKTFQTKTEISETKYIQNSNEGMNQCVQFNYQSSKM